MAENIVTSILESVTEIAYSSKRTPDGLLVRPVRFGLLKFDKPLVTEWPNERREKQTVERSIQSVLWKMLDNRGIDVSVSKLQVTPDITFEDDELATAVTPSPFCASVELSDATGKRVRRVDRIVYRGKSLFEFYKKQFLHEIYAGLTNVARLSEEEEITMTRELKRTAFEYRRAHPYVENPLVTFATKTRQIASSLLDSFKRQPKQKSDPVEGKEDITH